MSSFFDGEEVIQMTFAEWVAKKYGTDAALAGELRKRGHYTTRQGVWTWKKGSTPTIPVALELERMGWPIGNWDSGTHIVQKQSSAVSKKKTSTDNGAPTSASDVSQTNGQ